MGQVKALKTATQEKMILKFAKRTISIVVGLWKTAWNGNVPFLRKPGKWVLSPVLILLALYCGTWFLYPWVTTKEVVAMMHGTSVSKATGAEIINTSFTEFRNEDCFRRLKWNSGRLQAYAQRYRDEKVLIRYYGTRNMMLSNYPNILSIVKCTNEIPKCREEAEDNIQKETAAQQEEAAKE
ncbi:MAG TPA: DUF1523 family protein [Patescibacteria group bacterium]|nr:DUF1523 family protein [Patescibacteria group bacterium]